MGKIADRKVRLIEYLKEKGKLSVSEVGELFGISLPSARRFCAGLEKEQLVIRTHGGIRFIPPIETAYTFDVLDTEYNAEKETIAKNAIGMVKDNQCIFLEAGTTVKQFAIVLAGRIRKGEFPNLKVFTNSLANLEVLEPVCSVTMIGGLYRPERRDFSGFLCEKLLHTLRFDQCFLGADAINLADGIMGMDIETVRLDEILVMRSDKTIILTNSEKFRKHSLISYCSVDDVSAIITDSKLPKDIEKEFEEAGINILCA
jgi:DeoR/GlpR family transcriptional regulator of sugar metabolism